MALRASAKQDALRAREKMQSAQAVGQQIQAKRAEAEHEKRLSDFYKAEIERMLSGSSVGSRADGAGTSAAEQAQEPPQQAAQKQPPLGHDPSSSSGAFPPQSAASSNGGAAPPPVELLPPPPALEELSSLADSGRQLTHLGRAMAPRPGTKHRGLEIGTASRREEAAGVVRDRARSEPNAQIVLPSEALVLRGEAFARTGSAVYAAPPSAALEDLSKPPPDDYVSDSDDEVFGFVPPTEYEGDVLPKPGNKKMGEVVGASGRRGAEGRADGVPASTPPGIGGSPAQEKNELSSAQPGMKFLSDLAQSSVGHLRRMFSHPKLLSARSCRPGPKRPDVLALDDGTIVIFALSTEDSILLQMFARPSIILYNFNLAIIRLVSKHQHSQMIHFFSIQCE